MLSSATSTLPPLSPYFDRILDQVLRHAQKLVAVAAHKNRLPGQLGLDVDAPLPRHGRQGLDHLGHDGGKIDVLGRREMGPHLDARQGQEIVDQALHALRLPPHDVEEPLAGLRVVAGRALQGLDEAEQRGQRGAQLMARIGHEIGPHGLQTAGRGEIAKEQDDARLNPGAGRIGLEGADMNLEGALGGNPLRILDLQGLALRQNSLDAVEHIGAAEREGQGVARLQSAQETVSGFVGLDHQGALIDQDDRIGDLGQNRLGDAGALRLARLRPDTDPEAALGAGDHKSSHDGDGRPEQKPGISVAPHQGRDHHDEAR